MKMPEWNPNDHQALAMMISICILCLTLGALAGVELGGGSVTTIFQQQGRSGTVTQTQVVNSTQTVTTESPPSSTVTAPGTTVTETVPGPSTTVTVTSPSTATSPPPPSAP